MITKKDLVREIKRQYKEQIKEIEKEDNSREYKEFKKQLITFNFLGFIENKELSREVEDYFKFINRFGAVVGYDWVNGNEKLKQLIKEVLKWYME